MSKYIVKNCPGLLKGAEKWAKGFKEYEHFCNEGEGKWCQDCTDCKLKRVVEKCKKEIRVYRDTLLPNDGTNTLHFGRQSFAYDILKLLDIQEVE